MSSSLLYHAFGLRGYRHVATRYEGGNVFFRVERPRESYRCAACGSKDVHSRGVKRRSFCSLSIGSRPTSVEFDVPRLWCRECGVTRQIDLGFADPKRTYTRAFERYVLELSRFMTIRDVALHLLISWDIVKDIQKRNLQKRFARPKLGHIQRIAIDEICLGRGRRFVTLVLDLDSGAVVYVGKGKDSKALDKFWRRLRASRAKIEAVATDFSAAYTAAVRKNLKKAVHVFDRFHVVKKFNEHLSELRRELHREATDLLQKKVLKGTRWLLLKNPEHLDDARNERQRLKEALELNASLATAYYLKEDLRQFWEQGTKERARSFLRDWCARADASGIQRLQKFGKFLQEHRHGLLAWYDHPISTGPLEGTNNKIKTLQRQSYGFRDMEFLELKILALHEAKHALVG